nr:methyltransferase-like protein 13 [Ipomoea batatas]
MYRDEAACNTYNYGDALYWDARYVQEAGCGPFDWYQRYAALRPFVRKYIPSSSRVLMVGCGNAVMSEDMVKDGYEDIVNVDISSVAIDIMKRKHEHIPQLQCICGTNAPISASQMLGEVSRLLKPGGVYMLITYGDPSVRMPHLNRPVYNWKIELYNIPRPGFQKSVDSTSDLKSYLEPIPLTEAGLLPADYTAKSPLPFILAVVCTQLMKQTLARYNKCLDSTETPKIVEKKPKVKHKRLAFLSSHYDYAVRLDIITCHVFCNTDQIYDVYPDAFSYAERQLLGKDLTGMGLNELRQLEHKLDGALLAIKGRKIEELRGLVPSNVSMPMPTPYLEYYPALKNCSSGKDGAESLNTGCDDDLENEVSDTTLQLGPPTGSCRKRKTPDQETHSSNSENYLELK